MHYTNICECEYKIKKYVKYVKSRRCERPFTRIGLKSADRSVKIMEISLHFVGIGH